MFLTLNINLQSWFLYKSDLLIFAKQKMEEIIRINHCWKKKTRDGI